MTPRLHELAAKYGVRTHVAGSSSLDEDLRFPRPGLEIAHELLAKLPPRMDRAAKREWALYAVTGPDGWAWYFHDGKREESGIGTFIDAIIALAERQETGA